LRLIPILRGAPRCVDALAPLRRAIPPSDLAVDNFPTGCVC